MSGITFFYSRFGRLLKVHGHTAREPTAEGTFNQIKKEFQPDVLWIYCPVSEKDTIMAVGLRTRKPSPPLWPIPPYSTVDQEAQFNFLVSPSVRLERTAKILTEIYI